MSTKSRLTSLFLLVIGLLSACGITKSKYVPYVATDGTDTTNCEGAALAWTNSVGQFVPANCGSCHFAAGSGTLILKDGDNNTYNRLTLKKMKGGTAEGLYNYISGSSHSGSGSIGDLTLDHFNTWLTAEAACE